MRVFFLAWTHLRYVTKVIYMCFLEARPVVQVIFLLRFLTGACFAELSVDEANRQSSLWIGALGWSCATCACYIFNGITDVSEDRINGSPRPIASGRLRLTQASIAVAVLGSLAITACAVVEGYMILGVAAMLLMGWMYSSGPLRLKRWPIGLATLAIVAALLTYFIGYGANGGWGNVVSLVVFATAMALWMGLVGQTKDLSDREGDEQAGRKSLPIVWGDKRARLAVSAVAIVIGAGFVLLAFFLGEVIFLAALVVAFGGLAVAIVALGPWSKGSRLRRRRPYRVFMVTQYLSHLVVLISVVVLRVGW